MGMIRKRGEAARQRRLFSLLEATVIRSIVLRGVGETTSWTSAMKE